ncbi:hypothetical protein PG985_006434 [Apiospora marii]|uniref:PLL-like beta propeller domain-containing protein n=1 Tax=Apiospora marii TaxID=335849 RepID=A0ABR1S812_9PEZI
MVGAEYHRDPQPGLEVVQQRNGEYAPEVALPDHGWIYPVHDANEQQKVLFGGLVQQRLQQTAQEQQYAQDYTTKYSSLHGNHLLTTSEAVHEGVPEAAPEVVTPSAIGSVGRSEYGGYRSPSKDVSVYSPPPRRPRRKIVIIVAVAVVVSIGAIVGGVVGGLRSRNSGSSNGAGATASSAPVDPSSDSQEAMMTGGPGSATSVAPGFAPTAISQGYPHLEVFAVSNSKSNSVYRKYRNSNASSEADFLPGGGLEMELVGGGIDRDKTPSIAVSWRNYKPQENRTEVHMSGTFNSKVYRKYHDQGGGANDAWKPNGTDQWDYFSTGNWESSPTQVRYSPEHSLMGTLYLCRAQPGLGVCFWQWTPENDWSPSGSALAGPSDLQPWAAPAAVAWAGDDRRLDVFAVSRVNNHLVHTWRDADNAVGTWASWEDLKGFVTTPPVAVSRAAGVLDVFVRGGDGGLWHLGFQEGKWAGWERVSGAGIQIQGQPEAISTGADTIDVFAWGIKGELLHKKLDNRADPKWSPAADGGFDTILDKGLSGPPRAVTDGTGDIHLLAYDQDNNITLSTLSSKPGVRTERTVIAAVPMV